MYCNRAHLSGSCRTMTKADERKNVLMKTGRCFVCLKKYHMSRDCRSSVRCSNCNGRHHSSICGKITDTVKSTPTPVDVSQSKSPLTPGSSLCGSPSPHSGSTRQKNPSVISMYVDSRTPYSFRQLQQLYAHPICHPRHCAQESYLTSAVSNHM